MLPSVMTGAVHVRATCAPDAVAVRAVGAVGRPTAVAVASVLYAPKPPLMTAATRNELLTPAATLPTTYDVAVDPVFVDTVVHDDPPLVLRSIR